MPRRVVVTGLGIVAPNGIGIPAFLLAIQEGVSGLKFIPEHEKLKFTCQVSGLPDFVWEDLLNYIPEVIFRGLKSTPTGYGLKAAIDAWIDAGFDPASDLPQWDTGCVFGNGIADTELVKKVVATIDALETRKLGSRIVEQLMSSGIAAYISGRLGLAGRVFANSAACATGSQAILIGYEYIKYGQATRMVVGSSEYVNPYVFATFDSMRILPGKYNHAPTQASRPMSRSAAGFIPSSGAGALILEELESALARNANIYAEISGGAFNSGGQRNGGSMTASNPDGIINCIVNALKDADTPPQSIDLICGHLTATGADKLEIQNWIKALNRPGEDFPMINSLKSMIGHCLSAAGSIETIASILQIRHQFIHPNINLEDPNPEITALIPVDRLPSSMIKREIRTIAKANFGFGDTNTCLILSKFENDQRRNFN